VLGDERYLVVLNFTGNPMSYELPGGMTAGRVVMTNLAWAKGGNTLQLGPWEARVYRQ
jgi:oligo-1,6-glucosidase